MKFIYITILSSLCIHLHAATWHVGPTRTYTYCSQVAPLVQNGDTIFIDPGVYVNDPQVQWTKNNLYIAGPGGRPRLEAGTIIANDMVNGKGIFVISGSNVHVDNIEFANAVVQDNNGAGIRQEGANLLVTNCKFDGNEMGILGGNIPNCKTTVEFCEFVNGGSTFNPGYQHNIYINHIDTLVFRYNYSHDAIAEGHELKSRAAYNFILYNRIANETSEDSRTIDLPNGGTSVIIGNIIEQGPISANSNLLGYGQEGLTNPAPHELYCCNNTFINKKSTGNFIQIGNGTAKLFLRNNIFAGAQTSGLIQGNAANLDTSNNHINQDVSVFDFVNPSGYDYHLNASSPEINAGIAIQESVAGHFIQPAYEYVDQSNYTIRPGDGQIDIGAFEFTFPSGVKQIVPLDFSLSPNPAKNEIAITLGSSINLPAKMILYSTNGQLIRQKELTESRTMINLGYIPKGAYFIMIAKDKQKQITTLIIQ